MSKFESDQETGYKRVADVIEDFVVEATEAVESKRLPRSVSATGEYICISNTYNLLPLAEGLCWKYFELLICGS